KQYNLKQDVKEAWFENMAKTVEKDKWLKALKLVKYKLDPRASGIVYPAIKNVGK
ncbi:22353_t:CDS:1, partial [Gigaspora margarita]